MSSEPSDPFARAYEAMLGDQARVVTCVVCTRIAVLHDGPAYFMECFGAHGRNLLYDPARGMVVCRDCRRDLGHMLGKLQYLMCLSVVGIILFTMSTSVSIGNRNVFYSMTGSTAASLCGVVACRSYLRWSGLRSLARSIGRA